MKELELSLFLESLNDDELEILLEAIRPGGTVFTGGARNPQNRNAKWAAHLGLYELNEEGKQLAEEMGTLSAANKYESRIKSWGAKAVALADAVLGNSRISLDGYTKLVSDVSESTFEKFGFSIIPLLDSNGKISKIVNSHKLIQPKDTQYVVSVDDSGKIITPIENRPPSLKYFDTIMDEDFPPYDVLLEANTDLANSKESQIDTLKLAYINDKKISTTTLDKIFSYVTNLYNFYIKEQLDKYLPREGEPTFYTLGGGDSKDRVALENIVPFVTRVNEDGSIIFNTDGLRNFELTAKENWGDQQISNKESGTSVGHIDKEMTRPDVKKPKVKVVFTLNELIGTNYEDALEFSRLLANNNSSKLGSLKTIIDGISLAASKKAKTFLVDSKMYDRAILDIKSVAKMAFNENVTEAKNNLDETLALQKADDRESNQTNVDDIKNYFMSIAEVFPKLIARSNEDTFKKPLGLNRILIAFCNALEIDVPNTRANWQAVAQNITAIRKELFGESVNIDGDPIFSIDCIMGKVEHFIRHTGEVGVEDDEQEGEHDSISNLTDSPNLDDDGSGILDDIKEESK